MKRNWELIREILLALEELPTTQKELDANNIGGYEPEVVSYHIQLLDEAGLLEGDCDQTISGPLQCWATRLTWNGHEFLDEIKSDTVWNKTKDILKEKGIGLSFEAISSAVKAIITNML